MASKANKPGSKNGKVRILERSKGYYWRHHADVRLHGPFATFVAALENIELRASDRILSMGSDGPTASLKRNYPLEHSGPIFALKRHFEEQGC